MRLVVRCLSSLPGPLPSPLARLHLESRVSARRVRRFTATFMTANAGSRKVCRGCIVSTVVLQMMYLREDNTLRRVGRRDEGGRHPLGH
jgi:hypothetical protein